MRQLKICPNKGCLKQAEKFEFAESLSFCTMCGAGLEQGLGAFCHHCKKAIKPTWNWCGFCGKAVSTAAMAEQRDREREAKKSAKRKQRTDQVV